MRWLLALVLGLVVLVPVAAAIVLGPAHLQIRRIAPPLPDAAALRALARQDDGPVSIRALESSSQPMAGRTLGHTIFLVEWADGRIFMIDAGMDREASVEFGELMRTLQDAGAVRFGGTAADFLGEDVGRVAGVGFTHLHVDHVQGIETFCEARGEGARVYRTRWQAAEHNLHTEDQAAMVARSCLAPTTLEGGTILTTDDFPGLGIVGLGGHTPGSTLFVVPVDGTFWLISGDVSNVKANLVGNVGKGFVYSWLIVPEDTARTGELRRWLGALDATPDMEVLVSHDIAATEASGVEVIRSGRRTARADAR